MKATLVLTEAQLAELRGHLLRPDRLERTAFILFGRRTTTDEEGVELFAHRLVLPRDDQCRLQSETIVEPSPEFVLDTLAALRESGVVGLLHAHSHPFTDHATFSGTDDRYAPGERLTLVDYMRNADASLEPIYARLVWGREERGFDADVWDAEGPRKTRIEAIRAVGPMGIRGIPSHRGAPRSTPPETLAARLDRNVRWLGEEGQRRLTHARLAVCGAGGIGSALVAILRGLGFRELAIIDPDRVEETNLNRLFGAKREDVGSPKVEVAKREIEAVDPSARVSAIVSPLGSDEARDALLDAEIIVCGLDAIEPRFQAQILAARYAKPLLDLGSGIRLSGETSGEVSAMGGQAILYVPGGPCLLCQGLDVSRILSPEHRETRRRLGYVEGTDETPPSVVTLNAILAGLAGDLLVRYLTGFAEVATHVSIDLLSWEITRFAFQKRAGCLVCGSDGCEGRGDEEVRPLRRRDDARGLDASSV